MALRSIFALTTVPSRMRTDDVLTAQIAGAPGLPVGLDFPPGPADDVLAHGAGKQRRQSPLDAPRVGAREIDRGDQRFGPLGQPLIAAQSLRAPFSHRPVIGGHPGTRHPDRLGAERSDHLPLTVAVAVAAWGLGRALVPPAPQRRLQLLLDDRLDEPAHPAADAILDRIAPVGAQQWQRRRLGGSLCHGVISTAAATAVLGWFPNRRLRQPRISTTTTTAPVRSHGNTPSVSAINRYHRSRGVAPRTGIQAAAGVVAMQKMRQASRGMRLACTADQVIWAWK